MIRVKILVQDEKHTGIAVIPSDLIDIEATVQTTALAAGLLTHVASHLRPNVSGPRYRMDPETGFQQEDTIR